MPNKQLIERIIILNMNGDVKLDDGFNCKSYLYICDLLNMGFELITYNGYLLESMLWKYWNREDAKIVELMEPFAELYGESREWIDDDGKPLYIWQKLSTALRYYGIQDSEVDIYNPMEVIQKTRLLHIAMTDDEGVAQSEA